MNDLLIRIKKKSDGSAALSCLRADGSVTWQRQNGQQGRFFPLHDLTHYAVETVLGHTRSEEHTSELQSQSNLVCRLLLEKKNLHYETPVPGKQGFVTSPSSP